MNDFIVDFQVTSKCNLNCKFCCGADKKKNDSDINVIKNSIDKLKMAGVDRIVITGGEPLVRKDIDEIIKYISQKGIKVYLSTNGHLIDNHMETITSCVDCVGLPLDGDTYELSEQMTRNKNQIDTTMHAVKLLKEYSPDTIIKIGTVVSKINVDKLMDIGEFLYSDKNKVPDVWRLYQFTPLGEGYKNNDIFEIPDETFESVIKNVKNKFYNHNVGSLSNAESNDTYMFVAPDMELVGLTNDDYVSLGNLQNMNASDIVELRNKMCDTFDNAKKNREWIKKKEEKI